MFKTVAIKKKKFHSSQHLVASFRFCDDDTEFSSVSPFNDSNRSPASAVRQSRPCLMFCLFGHTREASAVVDGEFLSRHAITDHRKINGGKNQYVCGRLDVASQPFIPPLAEDS